MRERAERREVCLLQLRTRGVHHRQRVMAIGGGATVAGNVLDHRENAARHQARGHGAAERDDLLDRRPICAVADHVMGTGDGKIENRRAVCVDAERAQILGRLARGQRRERAGLLRIGGIERAERGGVGQLAPQRRPQALHAAAFLVDQNERAITADCFETIGDKPADLVMSQAIAREQDDAGRSCLA